jgi:Flp pilus assembly protein TadD
MAEHLKIDPEDLPGLHRWFGVELNNRTWKQLDEGIPNVSSSDEEKTQLLIAAFASAYHWSQIGTAANRARGEHLISRTALRVGEPGLALTHARRCLALATANPDVVEDWDFGFAHEALARALAASGNIDEAREHLVEARRLTAAVADQQDREILEAEINRGEWFELT